MSRTVVIALDRSDLSARALPFAQQIAQQWRGRLVLVHALGAQDNHAPVPPELTLRALATELNAMGIPSDVVTRRGPVAPTIANVANERHADLVVMASRQRYGASRWLHGSITEDVLSGTSTPLLVIPGQGTPVSGPSMRVLVPMDGTPTGEAALDFLRARSTSAPLDVSLVRVISYGPMVVGLDPALSIQGLSPAELDAEVDEARTYLASVANDVQDANLRVRHAVVESANTIAEVILETARRERRDLIAIGTHAKAGLSRLVLGSVSEEVLERSPVPVLLVHRSTGGRSGLAAHPRWSSVAGSVATASLHGVVR